MADVRSRPFSRLEWFSRPALSKALRENGIRYVFLGAELGARRDERECYVGDRADYGLIAETAIFQEGMKRLRKGVEGFRVAIMSTKKDPLDCHRGVLISRYAKEFSDIIHIHADGGLERHGDLEARMMLRYGPEEADLFRSRDEVLDRDYKRRGEETNYVRRR